MTTLSTLNRKSAGFSLIEVLIAVLVLATGMLALAALQSALIRNSVDAKNRSQAMSIAVDAIERVRQNSSATIAAYNALAVGQTAWTPWQQPGGAAGAGASYSATYQSRQTVTRFVRDSNAAVCGGAANTPCFRPAVAAESPQAGVAEFKRIDVEVQWTDAQGNVRNLSTSDIVGTTTDEKTDLILDQTGKATAGLGAPVARIPKPSEAGIIPIAFGDNEETAASNPKPVTGRERGRTDETQFQVLTYSVDGDVATLNRIVDTRVLGCRCSMQGAAAVVDTNTLIGTPVQPTFWDGTKYTEPEAVANPLDGLRGGPMTGAAQNEQLCQACCLDHHDRGSNAVKFDPFRTHEALHKHYYDPTPGNGTVEFAEAASGNEYFEACRFIRVNGIFRVATDMRLELMNMLVTDPTRPYESVPLPSAADHYAESVKDFVNQRIIGGVADPVLNYPDVFEPGPVYLGVSKQNYQHNRGLYLDHLETPALEAIANARAECSNGNLLDCVLPFVPVVSINTTEISQWRTAIPDGTGDVVSVTSYSQVPNCRRVPCLVEPQPARGVLAGVAEGIENNMVAQLRSNTGVSDSLPIDHQDAALASGTPSFASEKFEDTREVRVGDGCGTERSSFRVDVSSNSSDFSGWRVRWDDPETTSTCGLEAGQACSDIPSPLSANCKLGIELPHALVITFAGYNRDTGRTTRIANPCSGPANVNVPVCANFAVARVSVDGSFVPPSKITSTLDGKIGERTIVDLRSSVTVDAMSIVAEFTQEGTSNGIVVCGTHPLETRCE